MKKKRALVLSGGGARGAYQVGVLKAISEISKTKDPQINIYTGISAGAINATFLASHANDFHGGVQQLVELWSKITSDNVFSSDLMRMGKLAFQWVGELSLGAMTGTTPGKALLETHPLRKLITDNLDFKKIQKHIDDGTLWSVALTATDYQTSESVTFVQGQPEIKNWHKNRRHSEKTVLNSDHVMASSAIPMLFPPIQVHSSYYGDGCVRNSSPCAPSIYMGAEELLVVGVRMQAPTEEDLRAQKTNLAPTVARVLNVLLNAILLDGIENDVAHLERMNEFIEKNSNGEHHHSGDYRRIKALLISPSEDIGNLAVKNATRLPRTIRYLLKGLGKIEDAGEIISYLLFDPGFCQQLIEMGYQDGLRQKDELSEFLFK